MEHWQPIRKATEIAEYRLLEAMTDGRFPVNSNLPGERELAAMIGVTRPTLREALQRLARDGWVEIQQGKPTRVRDYWREGNLGVLSVLSQMMDQHSTDFIAHLLEMRILLAPAYTRQAIEHSPREVTELLRSYSNLGDTPAALAVADWDLHRLLTQLAINPIFRLLLNSFQNLYLLLGEHYFSYAECRQHSRNFYAALLDCVMDGRACDAEKLTQQIMRESLELWRHLQS